MSWLTSYTQSEYGAVWRQLTQRRIQRMAICVVLLLVVIALVADFIAADQPILLQFSGRLYWFPNLHVPNEIRVYNNYSLHASMRPGDWAVVPIVPWRP